MGRSYDSVMRKQLCAVIAGLFILVGGMIGFSIAILAALPSMNESAIAPVEMNNDMKRMKADGLRWFNANVKDKFPSGQVTITATQIVDLIDKGHGLGVKFNTVMENVPTEVISNGIEAGCGIIEKMDVALSKDGSGDLGADLHRILSQGATLLESVDISEVHDGIKAATGILNEANRLISQVPSDQFKDMLHKAHSLLKQAESDEIVDHISQLGDGVSKILARLSSEDGLTIKL